MKTSVLFIALLFFVHCAQKQENFIQYVDPNIGSTHGRWFFYTPASLPFGMAKLAPHTNAYEGQGSWAPQGYDSRHTSIEGFGHFHEFQIGGVVVMPTTGKLKTIPGSLKKPDEGYRSSFEKSTVTAKPGYYAVLLKDYDIKAELTATERVGFHRYTFPKSEMAHIIFDVGHKQGESSDVTDAWIKWDGKYEVEGYVETYPEYVKFCDPGKRVKMYFAGRFNKIPEKAGSFIDDSITENQTTSKGIKNGLYFEFSTKQQEIIEIQVGLSYTSIENARLNLKEETKSVDFELAKEKAFQKWNEKLGRIKVEGKSESDKLKLYTGLYHALLGRGLSSDVNGNYIKNDETIGQIPLDEKGKPKYHHYNTDGIWGGFWNLAQLWALVYPEYLSDYIQSNVDFYQHTGWLHDGTAAGTFTNGVQTNFQGLLIALAYNCHIRDFNVKTAYKAARKNELEYKGRNLGNGKYDLYWFATHGYIPSKDTVISNGWVFNFGASHTLEYAFSSYAVSQLAKGLGYENDYKLLTKQAHYWKNLFDPETKFIRPKYLEGDFIENFDTLEAWRGFQEGNAFQYSWYVPHDIGKLIDTIGIELFNARLEMTFENSQKSLFGGGKEIHSFSGVEKLYNHGNQPCLHDAWLFNYSGKPWLTQKWVRAICNDFYGTGELHGYGFGQDEDQGQLGAWFVMASMGLLDVQGHTNMNPSFQFGSPLFDKITIQLNEKYYQGKQLIIETKNNSKENQYIQSLTLNASPVNNCWIHRTDLTKGGTLVFEMGKQPNKSWGIKNPPPSLSSHPSGD